MTALDDLSPAPRPRPGRRRTLVESALALAFLGALAFGATQLPDGAAIRPLPAAGRALPVDAVAVESVDSYVRTRRFAGEVRARRETRLGFERLARVTELSVDEGQRVRAGDLLATLDVRDLEARARALRAAIAAARALLAEQVAGPRSERVDAAAARVDELTARLDLAATVAERRAVLAERDAVSLEELQAAQREVTALEASAAAARAELAELEAGTRVERIEAQRAEVERLEADLSVLEVDLDQSRLTAPFDGVVRSISLDLGAVPVPGSGLVELVESSAPEVWIGVPPDRTTGLGALEDPRVRIDGSEYRARFRSSLPTIDPRTRTRIAVFELLEVEIGPVVPGQVAELELPEEVRDAGAWIATDGLVRSRRGLWAAFVLAPLEDDDLDGAVDATHRLERRELEILTTDGRRALVRGDLAEGELVLASGAQRVSPGQAVRLLSVEEAVAEVGDGLPGGGETRR